MNPPYDHADDQQLSIHQKNTEIRLLNGDNINYFSILLTSTYSDPCIKNVEARKHRALIAQAARRDCAFVALGTELMFRVLNRDNKFPLLAAKSL